MSPEPNVDDARRTRRSSSPFLVGALAAVLAALAFGVTTPILKRAGIGLGPFTTAALLYLGACASALALRRATKASGRPIGSRQLPRLALIAFFGAALAPTLYAWGLQRIGDTTTSLLLNLEAVFTVLLASVFHREPIGRRVATALLLMVLGGVLLASDAARSLDWSALPAIAVGGATLAWAMDNTLSRPLADHDPVSVVAGKGGCGAILTGVLAIMCREPLPGVAQTCVLLACGATGYGMSLCLYLLAQRRIGAGRTGSIFALAPFVGAALAWGLGDRSAGAPTAVAAGLFALGVWLHATERHAHWHTHEPLEHEHAHRHDDGHHDHVHEQPVVGEHTHPHRHDRLEHCHEHAPDLHHDHAHGRRDRRQ